MLNVAKIFIFWIKKTKLEMLITTVTYMATYLFTVVTLPFIQLFGGYVWFIELVTLLSDWSEIVAIFFLSFLVIKFYLLMKDFYFKIYFLTIIKKKFYNFLPINLYVRTIFHNLFAAITYLYENFFYFITKKR